MSLAAVKAPDAAWTPASQQSMEADTLYMLDPAQDASLGLTPAFGGLVDASGGASTPTVVAGKYLQGYQPAGASSSFYWMPGDGILGADQFTIEFNAQANADWSTLTLYLLVLGGPNNNVQLSVSAGNLSLTLTHQQNASNFNYNVGPNYSFSSGTFLANTWYSIAATLLNGTLTLLVNGVAQGTTANIVSPLYWGSKAKQDGLWLPGGIGNHSSSVLKLSDLRISRQGRISGRAAIVASERSTITVTNTAGSTTIQPLAGCLHSLPNPTADTNQLSLGVAQSARMDKWMTATPIVAGGTDGTHPTAGHSGSFSYDWQAVDRTVAYFNSTLGVTDLYVTVGGNAQITGGTVAPFTNTLFTTSGAQQPDVSGTMLFTSSTGAQSGTGYFTYSGNVYRYQSRTGNELDGVILVSGAAGLTIPNSSTVNVGLLSLYAWMTSYDSSVPNNLANNAKLWADLAYHITVDLGKTATYWGVGNEPDGGAFWAGTLPQYLLHYQAIAGAIKGVSAGLKVGGPDISSWQNSAWIQALIYFCGTLPAPTGVTASAQVGGGTFNGSTTRFYKAVYRNASGNSVGSNEVSATPALNGSVLLTLPYQPGATTIDIYAATSTGGQTAATSLLTSGLTAGNQASVTFTDTGAALTTGAIPASATASGVTLDFLSWHYYQGDISEPYQVRLQVDAWCTTAGLATGKPLINGEWSWQNFDYRSPWQQTSPAVDYIRNDWSAGFMAASMIQCQANNVVRSYSCDFLKGAPATNVGTWHYLNADHLFDASDGHVLAPGNVYRLWSLITANTVYSSSGPNTVACDPGIQAVWSKNGGSPKTVGGITIPANAYCLLIANLHYRKVKHDGTGKTAPTLVTGIPVADGTNVTAYVVDDQHSNAYDAGLANASLQTTSTTMNAQGVNKVSGGQVGLVLRPRAAALLVVG